MVVKRVGILYHPLNEAARTLAGELEQFIGSSGVSAWSCSAWEEETVKSQLDNTEILLTIGGDGTILRAAQAAVPGKALIVGVNLGRLGFMTELSVDEVKDRIPVLLNGEGWVDERVMLEAQCLGKTYYALNDVVVARGTVARTVHIEAVINGEQMTTYRADGVIVATATGSTGYSLAAGGPILHPQAEDFVLVPIVPHLSPAFPVVLPSVSVVELRITTGLEAILSIDGHINIPLSGDASITVKLSDRKTRFLRFHPRAFYGTLEKRLKGKM